MSGGALPITMPPPLSHPVTCPMSHTSHATSCHMPPPLSRPRRQYMSGSALPITMPPPLSHPRRRDHNKSTGSGPAQSDTLRSGGMVTELCADARTLTLALRYKRQLQQRVRRRTADGIRYKKIPWLPATQVPYFGCYFRCCLLEEDPLDV